MIDSHCHLNFDSFQGRTVEFVSEARQAGVSKIINIGIDLRTSQECIDLAERFEACFATVGVHPHDAKDVSTDYLSRLRELAAHERVVAIGEIGLDFYRDNSPRDVQRRVFHEQLELAVDLGLPIVVHTRESFEESLQMVAEVAPSLKSGVFHCFPGDIDDARRVIDLGLKVSVGGIITFKNARMADMARQVDLQQVILETDAPFLAPVPHRGTLNQPAYVAHVYEKMAEFHDLPPGDLERIIDRNCIKLFGLEPTFGD